MKTLVVDASAAASWLLNSQATAASAVLLDERDKYRLAAPDIFLWETVNLIGRFAVRNLLDLHSVLSGLADLNIGLAPPLESGAVFELAKFANVTQLTLFDAAYLALAVELDAEIVSRDADLLHAAAIHGVAVHDLRVRS